MRSCPECGTQYDDGVEYCNVDGTRLPEGDPEVGLAVGTVLGSYRLCELLGEGGMGFVYLAEHTGLGRRVALKLLRPELLGNAVAIRRFFAEARAVNKIHHRNIVEITDFVDEGDQKYIIMELLEGQTFDARQRECPLPLADALGVLAQVSRALEAAHAAGIVHRDLKPANVFLTEQDGEAVVKVLDFGAAKLLHGTTDPGLGRTAQGAILGTPEYMSPEQAGGSEVDHRTDVYSLGVMLYEVATGRVPFTAKSLGAMVVKHLTVAPAPPSQVEDAPAPVPPAVESLVLRCLAKEPDLRPQSMAEVTAGLLAAREAMSTAGPEAPPRRPRRRRVVYASAVVGVGVVAVGVAALTRSGPPAVAPLDPAPPAEPQIAAAPPEPEPPASIDLAFRSTPEGATVRRSGDESILGTTPFTGSFLASPEPVAFEFVLPGHRTKTEVAPLTEDGTIEARLEPERPRPRKTARRRPKAPTQKLPSDSTGPPPVDETTTLNPFD